MKNNQSRPRASRKPALNSISMAVLATLIAGGAQAADTTFNDNIGTEVANGYVVSNSLVENGGRISATVQNATVGTTVTGTQTGNTASTTANTIAAGATGNTFANTLDLSLIMDGATAEKGMATLGRAANSAAVTSTAASNTLAVTLRDFENGTVVNKDNTISATTVVNRGVSTIAGTVPVSYLSATQGTTSITDNEGLKEFTAAGSIVSTSAQQTVGAISAATASGNSIHLKIFGTNINGGEDDTTVYPSAALTGNTVSASIKGNSAASTIAIEAGGKPTFTGSAVLGNMQLGSTSSATASNTNSSVLGKVYATESDSILTGTLAVTGNAISSSAMGNEALGSTGVAGNRILLGDGLSFAGTATPLPGANLTGYAGGTAVSADLVIANTQSNRTTPTTATTSSGSVVAEFEYLRAGTVDVLSNSIKANAMGNAASSALASGTNAASFAGSAAVANQQTNTASGVTASNIDAAIRAEASLDLANSTVSLTSNRTSSNARGNEISQSLALEATTLTLGTAAVLTDGTGTVTGAGAATVSNLQVNATAPVTATTSSAVNSIYTDAVTKSTLTLGANTQEAVALSNNAANTLSLKGTSVDTGAGIASVQQINAGSSVAASLTGSAIMLETANVTGSTVSATSNLQRAIGYGNLASNDLSVTAIATVTGVEAIAPGSTIVMDTVTPLAKALTGQVTAGYGIRNDQSVLSNVSASATGTDSVHINTGTVGNSKLVNEGNAFAAVAYGNNGTSGLTLKSTSITSVDDVGAPAFSTKANITSTQAVNAAITATATPGTVALTTVNGNVDGSTVSASSNSLESLATGSLSSNALNVNANSVVIGNAATTGTMTSGSGFFGGPSSQQSSSANAAFSLQNVQLGQGSVTATQLPIAVQSDVRIAVTGTVIGSTLAADTNTSTASSTSNSTVNALGMNAGTLATSSALQNVQTTTADVKALIGTAGTAFIAGIPDVFHIAGASSTAGTNASLQNGVLTVNTGSVVFSTAGVASGEKAALNTLLQQLGFTVSGNNATLGAGVHDLTSLTGVRSSFAAGKTTFSFDGYTVTGTPDTLATPNHGGVTLAIGGGTVTNAQLSVSGNATRGFAAGNRASNSTSLQGNDIASGSASPLAITGITTIVFGATADHTVSNAQTVAGENSIDSNVYGTLAIDVAPGANITGSSLKVSNNSQGASAVANTAGNSLALQGNSVTAVSALQSVQTSQAAVSAASDLELFAPGGVSNSKVLLSGNSNSSLAVINDVTNSLSVSGTLMGKNLGATTSSGITAENALLNMQYAETAVSSTATTRLYNQEALATTSKGLTSSSLTMSGNSTAAEASANRALNTASVNGTSTQAASVALGNIQQSDAVVTATATTAANLGLTNATSPVALNSTVLIDGNSTTALARGNTATNVLNSLAGSAYGTATGGTVDLSNGMTFSANAGILNQQTNRGNVLATSTAATYMVALNSGNTSGSVGVTGNQVAAQAYGNTATNSMTLNALNTTTPVIGATAAVGNSQFNSGNISATVGIVGTVNTVAYGVGITGPVSNSTLRTNGNQITATAVGNSVVSSILAAR